MKRVSFTILLIMSLLASTLSGCDKTVQDAKEDFIYNLITNNLWLVTNFNEGGTNITASFSPYEFKFNKDASVYGQKPGDANAVGTWKGDATSMTITSNFPAGPSPLDKLNGIWSITKTTLSSVKATRTEGSVVFILELQKK